MYYNVIRPFLIAFFFSVLSPNEQVQFILGEDHSKISNELPSYAPCLFTQMAHLKHEYGEPVWKEAARYGVCQFF